MRQYFLFNDMILLRIRFEVQCLKFKVEDKPLLDIRQNMIYFAFLSSL